MSRFSLRSNAEQTKLSEQKEKSKPLTNPLKTPTKKADNKKGNRNYVTEKQSPIQQTTAAITNSKSQQKFNETIEQSEVEERDGNISIICSLPLSRLTGIIEKLSLKTPQKYINNAQSLSLSQTKASGPNKDQCDDDDVEGNGNAVDGDGDVDEKQSMSFDDDTSNSKSQDQILVKTLCLYCEKKFSTFKMQQKHIEKFHSPQKDRRCSIRNSQVLTSPRSKSANRQTINRMLHNYPGCIYCKKGQNKPPYESNDPVRDFNGLFLHLTEQHADRYFGCKICIMRFQNVGKLMKHMQSVHNTLPEAQLKLSKDYNDISDEPRTEPTSPIDKINQHQQQQQQLIKQQRHAREHDSSASNSIRLDDQTDVMNVEDTILTRLGLTQNRRRMPSNRKGVRLRRDNAVSDILLKNDITITGSTTSNILAAAAAAAATAASSSSSSTSTSTSTSPTKSRTKATAKSTNINSDPDAALFRVPARTDISSAVFDENFYKEVTANVRNNLLFHLDGKLDARQSHNVVENEVSTDTSQTTKSTLPLLLRSTIASTVTMQEILDSNLQETEIHVATNLPATTAFPTLLTAEQYCGDVRKIRRPHTKHSWKWKWDSVKKYKLISEGGKMVKKAKQPMLGLRDLSKLDMWTQLSMRQKHEKQLMLLQNSNNFEDFPSGEKRRLNDQLNAILDTRVLPHIILEQSEQAIIKVENDEFNFSTTFERRNDEGDDDDFYAGNIIGQTFADENFLSMLQLLPRGVTKHHFGKLVLSGEWARPRCYLCMCCGNKFEKLKSLEEHKMFRHSNIFSTHYEVVGRELLAGNLLQHLFIPKRALSYYIAPGAAATNNPATLGSAKQLMKYRRINLSAEEESSDSVQSVSNSFVTTEHTFNLKNVPSTTDDCDTDTKTTLLGGVNTTVSPSHSIQSSFSSSLTATSSQSLQQKLNSKESTRNWNCSKCNRKCNGMGDLYRHMLDCSGDYIWSLAKKRKYRYYCGSKKRRPLHRQHSSEIRKKKQEKTTKTQILDNCTTEESSSNSFKPKTPPRPRPSDAESIKKMLENLPPKRVCKTIFPAVNKAKKTKKPKFMTKLYNTKILRKTRARQLSNSVKRTAGSTRFATKTKTQNKTLNSIKCRTRKNINPKKQSNNSNIIPTTDTDSKTGGNSNASTEKRSTPKKEQTISNQEVEQQQTNKKDGNNEKELKDKITKDTTEQQTMQIIEKSKDFDEVDNKSRTENIAINSTEAAKTKENQNLQQNSDNTKQKNSKAAQQVENNNCQRKRSKRISDCIAMLTGKLEEKLKTETTPTANARIDEVILENTDSKQSTTTTTTPAKKEKKTPKRKTISRRIIKTDIVADDNEVIVVKDKNEQIPISTSSLVVPTLITTTAVTTTPTAVATITTVATTVKTTKVTTTPTTTTTPIAVTKTTNTISKTKTTAIINATPIKALNKNMPTITTPPSAPAKIILPPPITPPTLVSIPISIASTLHAVPVPLKVLQSHLPVYLPTVQQNINAVAPTLPPAQQQPSATITLPVAASTLPLALANPNATSSLLPSITLLPPPPLIQAHVSPVLTAASTSPLCGAMEPLNLTSSKNAKKQTTAELRAQRPGMPARRQTICGFEARDLLTYNDMEPLDLSIKSKKSTAIETSTPLTIKPALVPVDFTTTNNQNMKTKTQAGLPATSPEEITLKPSSIVQLTTLPPPPPPSLPTTTTDTIFNKQFYSNLELLKIPQIRASGFLPTLEAVNNLSNGITVTPLPLPMPLTTTNNESLTTTQTSQSQQQAQLQIQTQTQLQTQTQIQLQPQTPTQKVNNKKRGSTKVNLDSTPIAKESNVLNKRENVAKNKAIAKMDDEVINHIDDAINSVINAVKASLYETEIQEQAAAKAESKPVAPLILENNESKLTAELIKNKENSTQPSLAVSVVMDTVEPVKATTASMPIVTTTITNSTTTVTTKLQQPQSDQISILEKSSPQTQQDVKVQNNDQRTDIPITTTATETPSTAVLTPTTVEILKPTSAITSKPPSAETATTTKSSTPVTTPKSTQATAAKPTFALTPKKRNLRSKTLDCRSQLLEVLQTPTTTRLEKRTSPVVELPVITSEPVQPESIVSTRGSKKRDVLPKTVVAQEPPKVEETLLPPTTTPTTTKPNVEKTTTDSNKKVTEKLVEKPEKKILNEPIKIVENKIKITNEEKKTDETALQESTTTNINLTLEENMSNINNTSSGFHSSSTPENGGDVKKKQRRRRKNELAAIVADQLLESFKIDKARRDSLKKLENMAYEKSEDLLLTGMLLMSSTKRTASSAVSFNQNAEKQRNESAKRQKTSVNTNTVTRPKSRNRLTNDQNSAPTPVKATTIEEKELITKATKPIEVEPIEITPRRGRRRTTRRKGVRTPLDNENLSKLKSSLESFSIGIEKQLSEFEARNTLATATTTTGATTSTTTATATNNVFNTTESKTRKKNSTETLLGKPNTTAATTTATVSSILRPSILSATLEQAQVATVVDTKTQKELEKIEKSEKTTDGNNTKAAATSSTASATNFSRDPRLNKNIHKDENPPLLSSTATTDNVIAIADNEDDNYLTEIAKNVNEKIMSAENEDFAFADDDGFEIGTEFNDEDDIDDDDSNSKYSRPPTSMSVRSAPNFNDDHSNFGSICDENTNTEVMDMDLDDEMSVYTSFSQDLGRGRGRKRRRRRSILLKRRPKKRRSSHDLSVAEKFECELCKKTFFAATSLAKHNMTLAHVSKVSEREYLLSKSGGKSLLDDFTKNFPKKQTKSAAGRRKRAQSMYLERPLDIFDCQSSVQPTTKAVANLPKNDEKLATATIVQDSKTTQRLSLNPDERLFYECCNILKSADTTRLTRAEQDNENQNSFMYPNTFLQPTTTTTPAAAATSTPMQATTSTANMHSIFEPNLNLTPKSTAEEKTFNKTTAVTNNSKAQESFKNQVLRPSSFQKITSSATNVSVHERQVHSPTYSQFSAVTNTTQSRFKTKAAMKGYENGNLDITIQTEEAKSRPTCKLTELADIALGHDDKHDAPAVAPKSNQIIIENAKRVVTPEYVTLSVVDGRKDGNFAAQQDNNRKTTETQGSTSSKTIMHSSIIKAAVEEHGKAQTTNRIIIPERPFKNIGLEEKETITFQKPKTTSVNLLMDDNSVSTASYSDRDDFDFNSMSCDDDTSIKTSNEKNLKSNSSDSSSSRATAKTFENKSLIMGRIFKNASTKAKATTVKSVGVQKDHTPKADLNQLFDELRNDGAPIIKTKNTEEQPIQCKDFIAATAAAATHQEVFSTIKPQIENSKTTIETKRSKIKAPTKKLKTSKKSEKEFCKLQTEMGMSQEEIEQLIDEGQRKSKRRCATNRSKKLVETWSSDEYEEFLSTKDIIALIEEKEKQEQRRKRKSSVVSDIKEKSLLTPATLATAESSTTRKNFAIAPIIETTRNQRATLKSTTTATTSTSAIIKEKEKTQKENAAKTKNITIKQIVEEKPSTTKIPGKRGRKPKNPGPTSNRGHKEEVVNKKSVIEKIVETAATAAAVPPPITTIESTAASETDDNLYLLDIKRNLNNNNNNSRKNKTKKDKSVKETKEVKESKKILNINVNSSKPQNRETESTERLEVIDTKRRSNCTTTTTTTTAASGSSGGVVGGGNKKNKGKRKPQTVKSPVRKRQAAEKLYYWSSSSSDEDFGRINEHEPEFENTEQYQKHGWIVGDSHKKLVTLLAIAKGNKKQVESCGVKKNVSKRK